MNYQLIPQINKAEILEKAVLNESPEQLAETYRELGYIEMTARALGLACRFCGIEKVRVLAECGAAFDIPKDETAERRYHCYSGMKYANYRTNYSLYLLKIFKQIKGACCCKGLKPVKRAATDDKKYLEPLPDGERLEVLRFLCENKDALSFEPSEMLYYAIFTRDTFIADELKRMGVKLSDIRLKRLADGGQATDSYWYEWGAMMSKLSDEDYLPIMKAFAEELGGKPFHCTGKIYEITKKRFVNAEILEFFRDNFKTEKLNKTDVIRNLINYNAAESLPVIEKLGWLNDPKRRDEMIDYAQSMSDRVECLAWLLDFKNRTADLAAEQAKAEKKMLRELNANPNSVTMLKKIWSYKKRENGNLIITNYKGSSLEVTVPGTIGKSTVTEIGSGAFAGSSGLCGGRVYTTADFEQQQHRRLITKVTLPESIDYIGTGAFADMISLTEINIPEKVMEIGFAAFYQCASLSSIVIPKTVERIDEYAFQRCGKLTAVVERGSFAEKYCKKNGIKFAYKGDRYVETR